MENEMNFQEMPEEETPVEEIAPEVPPVMDEPAPPAAFYMDAPKFEFMPKPPKKKRPGLRLAAIALCFSLLGNLLGAGGVLLAQYLMDEDEKVTLQAQDDQKEQNKQENTPQQNDQTGTSDGNTNIQVGQREDTTIDITQIDTSKVMTPAEVYALNVNSTVGITTNITTTNIWGQQSTSGSSGSGFVLTEDGYILTNHHVIEGANKVTVSMYDGKTYDAKIVGYDESNDIAVLKVEAEGLTPVVLGDSDKLNVGDSVVAIGNPLGELTFSLTTGVISAKDREVTFSSSVTMALLQTDCAINSGNSGGALFNLYGEVIGVTNAKYSSSSLGEASIDNIGFAIPVNSIMKIVTSIIEKGYISKPYIGVSITDVSAETQQYGVPAGVAIQSVTADSPAEAAGLKRGDVITAIDGKAMTSSEMVAYVGDQEIGAQVVLSIYRQGQTLEITVTIGEQIQSAQANQNNQQNNQGTFPGNR